MLFCVVFLVGHNLFWETKLGFDLLAFVNLSDPLENDLVVLGVAHFNLRKYLFRVSITATSTCGPIAITSPS